MGGGITLPLDTSNRRQTPWPVLPTGGPQLPNRSHYQGAPPSHMVFGPPQGM